MYIYIHNKQIPHGRYMMKYKYTVQNVFLQPNFELT